jgi:predicted AAA+ superfamily ATPase
MFPRTLILPKNNSFFLFGARGVGKSTLLKHEFSEKNTLWIDLLNEEIYDKYLLQPQLLLEEIDAIKTKELPEWIVIDEVQRVPRLLNIVHQSLLKYKKIKFALTGSSSRRLKQKGVNLLAGRAWVKNLFPLTFLELPKVPIEMSLRWGSLPTIYSLSSDQDRADYLRSYALTYIKTEVREEQWVRKLEPFRRFLPIAAQMNGLPLNYSKIARETGVDTTTVQNYFDILADTLLGFNLLPYHRSIRKQQRAAPKFFFFDLGVKRAMERNLNLELYKGTSEYGYAFEHLVILEIYRFNQYLSRDYELSYLQTKDGLEVDLILSRPGEPTALIEIKSKEKVTKDDLRHLRRIEPDITPAESFLLSQDPTPKKIGNTLCLPWKQGIEEIFSLSFAQKDDLGV